MTIGAIIAAILCIERIKTPTLFNVILIAPLVVDGISQAMQIRRSTNPIRFATGIMFSIGFAAECFNLLAIVKHWLG